MFLQQTSKLYRISFIVKREYEALLAIEESLESNSLQLNMAEGKNYVEWTAYHIIRREILEKKLLYSM